MTNIRVNPDTGCAMRDVTVLRVALGGVMACYLLAITGCGTSQYNALASRGAARLRSEVKFQGLYAPTPIPDSPFAVRVPVIYTNSFTPESGHPDDGDRINRERMQPPFLTSDDAIKLMYESTVKDDQNQRLPYYLYIAAGEAKEGDFDKLATDVESGLKKFMGENAPSWETVDADTPLGKAIHWRKMRVEFPQPFFVKADGKTAKKNLPGVFELWMHDAGTHIVILGWRAPKSIEGPQEGEFTVVNGLAVPSDNAKPDFTKWPVLTAGTLETR